MVDWDWLKLELYAIGKKKPRKNARSKGSIHKGNKALYLYETDKQYWKRQKTSAKKHKKKKKKR